VGTAGRIERRILPLARASTASLRRDTEPGGPRPPARPSPESSAALRAPGRTGCRACSGRRQRVLDR
jgi:hypothetical protein